MYCTATSPESRNRKCLTPIILILFFLFLLQNESGRTGLGSVILLSSVGLYAIIVLTKTGSLKREGFPLLLLAYLFLFSIIFTSSIFLQRVAEILYYILLICGIHYCTFGTPSIHDDRLPYNLLFSLLAGIVPGDLASLMPHFGMTERNRKTRNLVLLAFLGLILGSPFFILVLLLLSTDSAFGKMMDEVWNWIYSFDMSQLSTTITCILGAIILSLYYLLQVEASIKRKTDPDYDYYLIDKLAVKISFLPSVTVVFAVLPLIILYFLFFMSQWNYYTAAFTGSLPDGYSYAEYARSGFFELCTVAFINLFVLCLSNWFIRKDVRKTAIKVLTIILCICTLILITTAVSKLLLYINEYCLTPLRVYAMWAMILLSFIFLFFLIKEFMPKFPLYSCITITVILLVFVLIITDPPTLIANFNANRFIDGRYSKIDLDLFHELGDAGIPALVRIRNYFYSLSPSEQSDLIQSEAIDPLKLDLSEPEKSLAIDVPQPLLWVYLTLPYQAAVNSVM